MHNTRVWSFYTSDAAEMLRTGFLTLRDGGAGDLRGLDDTHEAFRSRFASVAEGNVFYRFAHEMREGDLVLLHRGRGAGMALCRVTGDYAYDGTHRRAIRTLRRLLPNEISAGAQREIAYASASVLHEVKHYAAEFLRDLGMSALTLPEDASAAERFAARWGCRRTA